MARDEIAVKGLFATPVAAVEILDPRGLGPGMYALVLKLLFSSWLYHQVRPYRCSGLRVSVGFNLGIATQDA